jgi:peptide/nickel transport system substrate-binding protein
MRNKLFVFASLLILASMLLAACQPAATPAATEPQGPAATEAPAASEAPAATGTEFKSKDPTTLVYATIGEPEGFDPALCYETAGGEIIQNVYETLVFYNKEKASDFVPSLAKEYTISEDGKTYTFTLNTGVTFSDGTTMTATDVAYSLWRGLLQGGTASPQWLFTEPFFGVGIDDISLLVDPEGGLYDDTEKMKAADPATLKATCEKVKSVIVPDDAANTVTMTLNQSWGPFLATLAQSWGSIMSQKWVAANGGWDGSCDTWQNYYAITSENDPFTSIAMGTGPFKLDSWTKGQEIVLTRNDSYWRTTPLWEGAPTGPAALERIVIKSIDEWGTRFAMMQAGDADFAVVPRANVTQIDPLVGEKCVYNNETGTFDPCAAEGDGTGALRLWIGHPLTTRTDVFLNFNIAVPEGGNPYLGSGKLDGNGVPANFFSDVHVRKAFNYCFDFDTYIADALAGEGFQSTGIAIPGMPGYNNDDPKYSFDPAKCEEEFKASELKSEDGKSLWDVGFRMQVAYNTGNVTRQTVAEILANNLAAVNEKFQIEIVGLPWAAFLRAQRAQTLPLFISGWQEDIHDPHNWYVPYITGTYGRRQSMPEEYIKEFGDIINAGVAESDPAKRNEIYKQLNQKVYDLAPDIILAISTGRHYEQRWVNGWFYNPIFPGQAFYYSLSKN